MLNDAECNEALATLKSLGTETDSITSCVSRGIVDHVEVSLASHKTPYEEADTVFTHVTTESSSAQLPIVSIPISPPFADDSFTAYPATKSSRAQLPTVLIPLSPLTADHSPIADSATNNSGAQLPTLPVSVSPPSEDNCALVIMEGADIEVQVEESSQNVAQVHVPSARKKLGKALTS